MKSFSRLFLIILIGFTVACDESTITIEPMDKNHSWKFAVVGDTHVTTNSDTISEMIPFFIQDSIDLLLICGDIVEGGKMTSSAELETELKLWMDIFKPLYESGIGIYPVRGNHEDDATDDISVWSQIFSGSKALPQNGPSGETNLTYSFSHKNAFFIGLDNYINIHRINQSWLDQQLEQNTNPHIFVFGHEAAFKVFHSDCLDDYEAERNVFWKSMTDAGVKTYFCGHDHFFDITQWDDGDGNTENDIYQCVAGGGGGWLMSRYNYNGTNSNYTPKKMYHKVEHGYLLVELCGVTPDDLAVTITWKERTTNNTNGAIEYIATDNYFNYQVEANN